MLIAKSAPNVRKKNASFNSKKAWDGFYRGREEEDVLGEIVHYPLLAKEMWSLALIYSNITVCDCLYERSRYILTIDGDGVGTDIVGQDSFVYPNSRTPRLTYKPKEYYECFYT